MVLKTVDGVTTPHKYEGSLDGRTELVAFVTELYDIYEPENGVLVLTDENWETAMDEFRQILVEFYAPVTTPTHSPHTRTHARTSS